MLAQVTRQFIVSLKLLLNGNFHILECKSNALYSNPLFHKNIQYDMNYSLKNT